MTGTRVTFAWSLSKHTVSLAFSTALQTAHKYLQNLSFNALPLFQNHKFGPLKFSLLFEFKGIFCKALECEKDPGIPKISGSL